MSLIIKIPCILLATTGIHLSLTPPITSRKSERTPHSGVWARLLEIGISTLGLRKGMYWAVGIAEIVAIIANESSSSFMRSISIMMVGSGNAGSLQFTPLRIIGFLLIVLGTLLRYWCFQVMEGLFTFEITVQRNHRLVKNGPYSMVRHPSYTAISVLNTGVCCWYGAQGSWLRESGVLSTTIGKAFFGIFAAMTVGIRVALLKRATVEDHALREKFGKEWEEWALQVPYAFIPGVY